MPTLRHPTHPDIDTNGFERPVTTSFENRKAVLVAAAVESFVTNTIGGTCRIDETLHSADRACRFHYSTSAVEIFRRPIDRLMFWPRLPYRAW